MKTYAIIRIKNTPMQVSTEHIDWRQVQIRKTVMENGKQRRALHCAVFFK